MNIEKLERVLHEMEGAMLTSPDDQARVRGWAARIHQAITEPNPHGLAAEGF